MKKYISFFVALSGLCTSILSAQCVLEPISLDQRIDRSDLIIEGIIIEQTGFYSETDGHIYTANTVRISKIFKGSVDDNTVVLISSGGQVGDEGETVHPSLYVRENISGIFFLEKGRITYHGETESFMAYSGPQGCIYYDKATDMANDVFNSYNSISEVHVLITTRLGNTFEQRSELPQRNEDKESLMVILSISPTQLSAGTDEVLTIYGTDFGTARGIGEVSFKNASSGPTWIEAYSNDYLVWTDTMIQVIVPSDAGTGSVRITQGTTAIYNEVKLLFSQLNVDETTFAIPTIHINENNVGGFDWQMSDDFAANTDAKNSFIRAMTNWSDNSCINWNNAAATPTNEDKQDFINNVRFAGPGELSSGVLGTTRNYWKKCGGDFAWASEIDMSFDPDKNWNFDASNPSLTEYDFESVAVHELGHAHQLGHVIDNADFMHYAVGPGALKRTFTNNNITAGLFTMLQNVTQHSCGPTPMLSKAGCSLPIGITESDDVAVPTLYPVPFSDKLFIRHPFSGQEVNVKIINAQGVQVQAFKMTGSQQEVVWKPLSSLSGGMYIVMMEGENRETVSKKVIYQP